MTELGAELQERRQTILALIERDVLETAKNIERGTIASHIEVEQHLHRTAYLRRYLDTLDELEKSK